ncbi:MAG TPA: N-acetylmuramoyl-L-alanine amidase [Candidatus Methylomirabilis sp.]|nr:N-acetylmuramoyl-L-alanine amidase [Candidatus Methylomirabilis sp.]
MSRLARNSNAVRGVALLVLLVPGIAALGFSSQSPSQPTPPAPTTPSATQNPATSTQNPQAAPLPTAPRGGLNVVVLDAAHGGTDPGARGTGGLRESDIVLDFSAQVRRALEGQGFQVVLTRSGNEDPSFDDRSAIANGQIGAVFVTLHIASTGLPGTVRVYVNSDLPTASNTTGLIAWDRAQIPFEGLSKQLGDLVQGLLAARFKGSPNTAQTAAVRQLRTTAAPAIAVEISSVVVDDRAELDKMAPGVAEAIAIGVAEFRPSYVIPTTTGATP